MRAGRTAVGLAILFLGLGGAAAAQEELSVSLGAGGFLPAEDLAHRIYGAGFAWSADVWLKLKGPFGLASGFGGLSDDGTAVPYDEADDAEYPVSFRRQTIPVVLFYEIDLKSVDIRAGAGLAIHSFRETWQTVEFDYKGSATGPRFLVAVRVGLLDRLSLLGSVTYDSFRAGADSPNAVTHNLGGFQICGGLSFRIF